MDRYPSTVVSTGRESVLATNKVLRNTYLLLGATLAFSAAMAGVSMALDVPYFGLFTLLGYFGLLFAVHKTRNSSWGIVWTFALTGFMGLTLGPILDFYIKALPNGSQLIMTSLGVTGAAFLGLPACAGRSQKDFSFMGGFLAVGAIGAFVLGLIAYFFNLSTLSLVVSGMFLLVSGGYILWQTSEIIRGGETNYITATVTLYVAIYNMFLSLLHILGVASGDD
jgi:modulator of FtsH protease